MTSGYNDYYMNSSVGRDREREDDLASVAIRPEIEESFCSNFMCCGVFLSDLHALLQHYEEVHIRIEDEATTLPLAMSSRTYHDVPPKGILSAGRLPQKSLTPRTDYGYGSSGYSASPNVAEASILRDLSRPRSVTTIGKKRRHITLGIEPCDYNANEVSAFDNTVLKTVSPADVDRLPPLGYGELPKRSRSMPSLRSMQSMETEQHYKMIYSLLSETLDSNSTSSALGANSSYINSLDASRAAHSSSAGSLSRSFGKTGGRNSERPYICGISGCGKTYKNPNGLKYHALHGHDSNGPEAEKPHRCPHIGCGKRYKNSNGLKYHVTHAHIQYAASSHSTHAGSPAGPSALGLKNQPGPHLSLAHSEHRVQPQIPSTFNRPL